MEQRLPSLHLLRLFEAAARLQSFKLAAEELHLTPSAVSHQIKALEEQLGVVLFRRLNRRIELTSGGQAYFDVVADAFKRLKKGTLDVLHRFAQQRLKISIMPSMARHFLIPRLPELRAHMPGVELVIDASSSLVDFNASDVDLAVRFGHGQWPELSVEKITKVHFSPMCSPELAEKLKLETIEDLTRAPLISFSFMTDAWLKFSHTMKLETLSADNGLTFSNYDMAIQAAEQGLGVVLGLVEMELSQLHKKSLVQPFEISVPMKEGVFLVYRHSDIERPEIRQFTDWFKEQFAALK